MCAAASGLVTQGGTQEVENTISRKRIPPVGTGCKAHFWERNKIYVIWKTLKKSKICKCPLSNTGSEITAIHRGPEGGESAGDRHGTACRDILWGSKRFLDLRGYLPTSYPFCTAHISQQKRSGRIKGEGGRLGWVGKRGAKGRYCKNASSHLPPLRQAISPPLQLSRERAKGPAGLSYDLPHNKKNTSSQQYFGKNKRYMSIL